MSSAIVIRPLDNTSGILVISGLLDNAPRTFQCRLHDSEELRRVVANLYRLKEDNFEGSVSIRFSAIHKLTMQKVIWSELTDALLAFVFRVDMLKLGL